MRATHLLTVLALGLSAPALAGDHGPYYGPMKKWAGFGYAFGYRDRVEADGSWRIDTASRGREATEMALYRAAELAREGGYSYVEMLGGGGMTSPGRSTATLYARPTRTPTPPASCWRKQKPTSCYTADVAEVLRRLSGPDGTQPGVYLASGSDKYGRQVSYSGIDFGFGVGAVTRSAAPAVAQPVPAAAAAVARAPAAPLPAPRPTGTATVAYRPAPTRNQIAAERFAQAARENRPVSGRQGSWAIGD